MGVRQTRHLFILAALCGLCGVFSPRALRFLYLNSHNRRGHRDTARRGRRVDVKFVVHPPDN